MNLVFTGLLRLLAVLGFGFISFLGFDVLISDLTGIVQSNCKAARVIWFRCSTWEALLTHWDMF